MHLLEATGTSVVELPRDHRCSILPAVKLAVAALLLASTFSFGQWQKLDSGSDASLRGVSAPSADVCWATGSKGTVLLTTDGGAHWTMRPVPGGESLDFRDVEAIDAKTAVIMSAGPAEQGQAKIFRTTDGGITWKQSFATDRKGVFLDSIAFWDKNRGVMFSDPVDGKFPVWMTSDGGESWHEIHPESMPAALPNEGAFAASGTAIAVAGKKDIWFGTGGASVARVFHSSDSGKHWTATEVPIAAGKASAGVFGVAFRDSKHGVAVGGDYTMREGEVVAAATTGDAGKTWKAIDKKMPPLQGVAICHAAKPASGTIPKGYIVLGIGNALTTAPNGEQWEANSAIRGNAVSCGNGWIYIVGPKGLIIRSVP